MKLYSLLWLLILSQLSTAAEIRGKIHLDSTWQEKVFLAYINSFDQLNTASYDFLIAESTVDADGNFNFTDLNLDEQDRLYRLYFCKIGDPVSTITIGGKSENFVHFIMNNRSKILISTKSGDSIFENVLISGHPANKTLESLFKWRRELRTAPAISTTSARNIARQKVRTKLENVFYNGKYSINILLAIHLYSELYPEDIDRINFGDILKDLDENATSSYLQELKLKGILTQKREKRNNLNLWIASVLVLITLSVLIAFFNKKNNTSVDISPLLQQLSVQEKKVYNLLKLGKTNKEISQELNIEVTTAKTHVRNVLSKLKVQSRKELFRID